MERKINSTLHIRVEPELRERLLELARAEDRPLSNLIRRAFGSGSSSGWSTGFGGRMSDQGELSPPTPASAPSATPSPSPSPTPSPRPKPTPQS